MFVKLAMTDNHLKNSLGLLCDYIVSRAHTSVRALNKACIIHYMNTLCNRTIWSKIKDVGKISMLAFQRYALYLMLLLFLLFQLHRSVIHSRAHFCVSFLLCKLLRFRWQLCKWVQFAYLPSDASVQNFCHLLILPHPLRSMYVSMFSVSVWTCFCCVIYFMFSGTRLPICIYYDRFYLYVLSFVVFSLCNQAHGIFCCDWFYFAYLILTLDFHFSNCSIFYSCWHSLNKKLLSTR